MLSFKLSRTVAAPLLCLLSLVFASLLVASDITKNAVGPAGGALTGTYPDPVLVNVTAQGSIIFQGAVAGVPQTDAANLVWDNVNKRFGVGTNLPDSQIEVTGTGLVTIHIRSTNNSVLEIDRGSAAQAGYVHYTTVGASNWILGVASSGPAPLTGNEFYIGTLLDTPTFLMDPAGPVGIGRGNANPSGTFDVLSLVPIVGATLRHVGWDGVNPSPTTTQTIVVDGATQGNVSQFVFTDSAGANPVGLDYNGAGVIEVNDGVANTITGDVAYERWIGTPVAFALLGAPADGQMVPCSDCTMANPCAGGGTGAFAKRLNGVWVCN